jgi:dTDP-4-amino-4,6-dideoxygalactose transaminase
MGVLSFNGNKIITTGGGGAILTNNTELARRAKHITTTAKLSHLWEYRHDEIGYNYRMPNINAALGCAQIEKLSEIIASKRKLYQKYNDAFLSVQGVNIVKEPSSSTSNYWLQTLILDADQASHRDSILDASNKDGLMTRPVWTLLHELDMFKNCQSMDLPVADALSNRLINIPSNIIHI